MGGLIHARLFFLPLPHFIPLRPPPPHHFHTVRSPPPHSGQPSDKIDFRDLDPYCT